MRTIIETCSYTISPSYIDGLPGGTIEPMSAGLVPIVSKYCGFASKEFIYEMEELNSACLNEKIDQVLNLSDEDYLKHSQMTRDYISENFSIKEVKNSFIKILEKEIPEGNG